MTNEQLDALKLADQLRDMSTKFKTPSHERGVCNGAIEKLRRLHAENQGQAERIQDIYKQLNDTEKEVDDLRAELHEEAKINGAGAERELKLMTDLENKQAELLRIKAHAEMQRMDDEALLRQALESMEELQYATTDKAFAMADATIDAIKERLNVPN